VKKGLRGAGLEFMEPPRSPFFTYASGRASPYGEQTAILLASLAARGGLDCVHYADAFALHFGDDEFDGYRDVSTKGFIRNYLRGAVPPLTGAADAQANCVARLAPLVAAFAGDGRLAVAVERATRTTQNSDAAAAWGAAGAAILERLVLGSAAAAAVAATAAELEAAAAALTATDTSAPPPLGAEIAAELRRALALAGTPHLAATEALGRNCHMPNALTTPLHAVLHQEALAAAGRSAEGGAAGLPAAAYAAGVRDAIRAGGCCASRSGYAGACLAALTAHSGGAALPADWAARCAGFGATAAAADALCGARGGLMVAGGQ